MTAFAEKLAKARKDPLPSIYSKEYKEQIWTLLIACGAAVVDRGGWQGEFSYYGGCLNFDPDKTTEIAGIIGDVGVNWEACSDPAPATAASFNGTFTDTQLYVQYFIGDLTLNNGDTTRWGAMSENEDFGELIRTITTLDITFEDAVEELTERVTAKYGLSVYSGCSIPSISGYNY